MHATSNRIGALVTEIQNDFLDLPGLALTLSEAARRFNVDTVMCRAVLDVLVDAGVLSNRAGAYMRNRPPRVARRGGAPVLQHSRRRAHTSGRASQAA